MLILDALKDESLSVGQGALYSLVAIIMVFAILLIIIGITTLVFKITGLWDLKKELDQKKENIQEIPQEEVKEEVKQVAITDDDMLAAVLVASIDYRQKIKKDVRLVSVKEVK